MSMERRIRKIRIQMFFDEPYLYLEILNKESIIREIPFIFTDHGQIYSDDPRIDNLIAEVVRDYEYLIEKKYPDAEQEMYLDLGTESFYIKKTIINNELKTRVVEIPKTKINYKLSESN